MMQKPAALCNTSTLYKHRVDYRQGLRILQKHLSQNSLQQFCRPSSISTACCLTVHGLRLVYTIQWRPEAVQRWLQTAIWSWGEQMQLLRAEFTTSCLCWNHMIMSLHDWWLILTIRQNERMTSLFSVGWHRSKQFDDLEVFTIFCSACLPLRLRFRRCPQTP